MLGLRGVMVLMMIVRPEGIWPSRMLRRRAAGGPCRRGHGTDGVPRSRCRAQPRGRRPADGAILEVKELSKQFGELKAVEQVSFPVEEGQIVAIIGPNGAGKTTLFNLITNSLQVHLGRGAFSRPAYPGDAGIPPGRAGHRPDLPEHPAVRQHDAPWTT